MVELDEVRSHHTRDSLKIELIGFATVGWERKVDRSDSLGPGCLKEKFCIFSCKFSSFLSGKVALLQATLLYPYLIDICKMIKIENSKK